MGVPVNKPVHAVWTTRRVVHNLALELGTMPAAAFEDASRRALGQNLSVSRGSDNSRGSSYSRAAHRRNG